MSVRWLGLRRHSGQSTIRQQWWVGGFCVTALCGTILRVSFFRYPGGKRKLRSTITNRLLHCLSPSLQYREPFLGGGGVGIRFLEEYPGFVKSAWINDKDIGIACIWTAVILYPALLIDRIDHWRPYSRLSDLKFFDYFCTTLVNLREMPTTPYDTVLIAFMKLVVHQQSYSGLGTKAGGPIGGYEQATAKYKIDCRWSSSYLSNRVSKISCVLNNIKIHNSGCTNLDFSELIEDTTQDSLLYLDPPYYVKGNTLYQYGFTLTDHARLAQSLQRTRHMWILSYDDCPEIRKLYEWAQMDEISVNYSITAVQKKKHGKVVIRDKGYVTDQGSRFMPELLIYSDRAASALQGIIHHSGSA